MQAQRAENTVMQALESLNDTQVNDFLSGKSPLNLSVRLGDHMMLIQLQLSTLNPGSSSNAASSSASTSVTPNTVLSTSSTSLTPSTSISSATARYNHRSTSSKSSRSSTSSATTSSASSTASSVILLPPNSSNKLTNTSSSSSYNKFKRHNSDDLNYNYNNRIGTNPPQHFHQHHHHHHHHSHHNQLAQQRQQLHHLANQIQQHDISTYLIKQEMENIQNMVKSLSNDLENKQQVQLISQPPPPAPPQPQTITKMVNNDVEMIGKVINSNSEVVDVESPIKSLSNLVSSPIKTTSIKNISSLKKTRSSSKSQYHNTDPITANLTSCLCSNLDKTKSMSNSLLKTSAGCIDLPNCQLLRSTRSSSSSANSSHRTTPHRTANNPIVKPKHRSHKLQPQQLPHHSHSQPHVHHQHFVHNPSHPIHHHHHNHQHQHAHHHHQQQQLVISQQQHQLASAQSQQNLPEKITYAENLLLLANQSDNTKAIVDTSSVPATPIEQVVQPVVPTAPEEVGGAEEQPLELQTDGIDNPALAEASRNLTQTLRKLSKRVFTNKIDVINESSSRSNNNNSSASSSSTSTGSKIGSGAVIESMKHHGKGIYSGTFSGTLNPALQDKYGRPKRDISTIIHILNDLLSAAPQCARSGAKIVFEPTSNSLTASSTSTSTNVNSSTGSSRHYSSSSRSSSRHVSWRKVK